MTLADEVRLLMAAPSMTANDACTLLRRDHDQIIQLARDLTECESRDERRALLKQLKLAIFAYTRAEQREIYDVLLGQQHDDEVREIASNGYVTHGAVDRLIERMTKSRKTESEEWAAYSQVLLELISQHVEKERSRLLALMFERFNDDEREAMGRRFVAAKSQLVPKVKAA